MKCWKNWRIFLIFRRYRKESVKYGEEIQNAKEKSNDYIDYDNGNDE